MKLINMLHGAGKSLIHFFFCLCFFKKLLFLKYEIEKVLQYLAFSPNTMGNESTYKVSNTH